MEEVNIYVVKAIFTELLNSTHSTKEDAKLLIPVINNIHILNEPNRPKSIIMLLSDVYNRKFETYEALKIYKNCGYMSLLQWKIIKILYNPAIIYELTKKYVYLSEFETSIASYLYFMNKPDLIALKKFLIERIKKLVSNQRHNKDPRNFKTLTIFGSVATSIITNEPVEDIDIYCNDKDYDRLLGSLQLFFKINIKRNKNYFINVDNVSLYWNDDIFLNIDLVLGEEYRKLDIDFYETTLGFDGDLILTKPFHQISMDKIIHNLQNKILTPHLNIISKPRDIYQMINVWYRYFNKCDRKYTFASNINGHNFISSYEMSYNKSKYITAINSFTENPDISNMIFEFLEGINYKENCFLCSKELQTNTSKHTHNIIVSIPTGNVNINAIDRNDFTLIDSESYVDKFTKANNNNQTIFIHCYCLKYYINRLINHSADTSLLSNVIILLNKYN